MRNVFSPWPCFTEEEASAVRDVLLSNAVNQWTGTAVGEFESAFSRFCGARHALAFSNGTTALDAALRAIGIGPGDEVIVTPRSFIASASCVAMTGARPVFADVDADSELITPETAAPLITDRTRAIVCVHLSGWPCDMDGFHDLVRGREIAIIEDCAQAHGALYKGRSVGSLGDIAAWSFCQDKIITTGGEGGMVTTNDELLFRNAWSYRDHGKGYASVFEREHAPGYRWQHETFGTNARMTALQAVIGSIQLNRLAVWHARRSAIAMNIRETGEGLAAIRVPRIPDEIEHAWYRCNVFVRPEHLIKGWSRDRIVAVLAEHGIPCLTGPCPEIYREKAFEDAGLVPDTPCGIARRLGETCLMFLVHPTLTDQEVERICSTMEEVLTAATGQP